MSALGIDDGLLRRLRDAGAAIAWQPAPQTGAGHPGPAARLARLREEEARVEVREQASGVLVEVGAGPVGALVLLLEADRRGPPTELGSRNAGNAAGFPDGSLVASWGAGELRADARPTLRDLVALARYALA